MVLKIGLSLNLFFFPPWVWDDDFPTPPLFAQILLCGWSCGETCLATFCLLRKKLAVGSLGVLSRPFTFLAHRCLCSLWGGAVFGRRPPLSHMEIEKKNGMWMSTEVSRLVFPFDMCVCALSLSHWVHIENRVDRVLKIVCPQFWSFLFSFYFSFLGAPNLK